jgi:hypothetical protein
MAGGLGLIMAALLLALRPRLVLAVGVLVSLGFAGFSILALVEASTWVSPLCPILACLAPGLAGLIAERLNGPAQR